MTEPAYLYIHVEEPSMEVAVDTLVRALGLDPAWYKVIDHGSKQRLLTDLPRRLRGYRTMPHDLRVMVLVDRDKDDCRVLKTQLEEAAQTANLSTKSRPDSVGRYCVVNRIVVEELEAWFLGDHKALSTAFPRLPKTLEHHARFRDPDAIAGGTWEALHRALQRSGYYPGHLPKLEVARLVSPHMTVSGNRSRSFQTFVTGLQALLT